MNIVLTIHNSISNISGLNAEQFKAVKKLLSYSLNAHYSKNYYGNVRYLIDKRGYFPTGLLYLVKSFLNENAINHRTLDTRVKPKSFTTPLKAKYPFLLRDEQLDAANKAFTKHRGILVLPTGTGKSLIIASVIEKLQVKTLIVVPTLELKSQLTGTLQEIFGECEVGSIKDDFKITVENVDALSFKNAYNYDCVIIDEFHRSGAKTYRNLNKKAWTSIYYRIGLTATPFRNNKNEKLLLESVLSEIIYELSYKDAVKKGYVVQIEPYFIEIPKTDVKSNSWGSVYSELVVNKKERNDIICEIICRLYENNQSTLVLVDQIKHGEILKNMLLKENLHVPFANGKDENSKHTINEFKEKKFPILIGSSILGEGIDTKPCEWVILAGGSGKSKGALMQKCGRAVRIFDDKKSAKIISFLDTSHKWFKKHHAFFIKISKEEYGVSPVNFFIDL